MSEGYNVTYSEKRNINVGNYESREVFVSISRVIDRHNHLVDTTATEKAEVETVDDAYEKLKELKHAVQETLDREERRIRKASIPYTDFETQNKMPSLEKYKG